MQSRIWSGSELNSRGGSGFGFILMVGSGSTSPWSKTSSKNKFTIVFFWVTLLKIMHLKSKKKTVCNYKKKPTICNDGSKLLGHIVQGCSSLFNNFFLTSQMNYCMFKKKWPNLCSNLQYQIGHYTLGI